MPSPSLHAMLAASTVHRAPQFRAKSPFRNRNYLYDDAGNRTQHTHTDNIANSTTYNLIYNDLNQLTQRYWGSPENQEDYSYDLNGNLIRKDVVLDEIGISERWDYTWDHENRLIKVVQWKAYYVDPSWELDQYKRVEFYYCPACGGNRTQKVVHINDNWSTGEAADWNLSKWLRYETLGLDQLRVDEKYDADENGLDEGVAYMLGRTGYGPRCGPPPRNPTDPELLLLHGS